MIGFLQTLLTFTIPILVVLTVVVTVHELGHFWAARACGVVVDRFSIGFGKAILSWKDKAGVDWRIGWLPLGGYVRFAGDENAASVPDQQSLAAMREEILARPGGAQALRTYYHFKPVWQRAIIAAAGPAANFALAILLFAVLYGLLGEIVSRPVVSQVVPASAAAQAGFRVGDEVTAINGRPVAGFAEIRTQVSLRANIPMRFTVQRGSESLDLTATPRTAVIDHWLGGKMTVGQLGIGSSSQPTLLRYSPPEAIVRGAVVSWNGLTNTIFYLRRLIVGQASADQIQGIVGMAHVTGKVTEQVIEQSDSSRAVAVNLFGNLLEIAAFLSISIGFFNLLPIPVLDGGHLAFYAYEAVARRPLPGRIQDASYRVGLALLLGFMLFATWNDLQRLNLFQFLGGLIS